MEAGIGRIIAWIRVAAAIAAYLGLWLATVPTNGFVLHHVLVQLRHGLRLHKTAVNDKFRMIVVFDNVIVLVHAVGEIVYPCFREVFIQASLIKGTSVVRSRDLIKRLVLVVANRRLAKIRVINAVVIVVVCS